MNTRQILYLIGMVSLFVILILACSTTRNPQGTWGHSIAKGPTPWSHEQFDDASDRFSFAIISDLYGGYREGILDVAIDQINLLRPELVLSVGDLIDGGTEDVEQLTSEWNYFDNKIAKLRAPFFHVGGNHDLTNTTMRAIWEDRYGQRYYYFVYNNVLFLVLDSEDYNEDRMKEIYEARAIAIEILDGDQPDLAVHSDYFKMSERRTGEISSVQTDYFLNVLKQHSDVTWTFLLMHKPVWMRSDDGGLKKIEEVLQSRPYTVINGHFHTYNYTLRGGRDYITLGTTGGSQNAESNMAFDHFMWVAMDKEGPSIAAIKMQGLLDKTGQIPANGETLCFQASICDE